ncbi:hypothetical protein [Natrialba aegyptia]|nr:hypothetical protein [Natrialba aegyptia]
MSTEEIDVDFDVEDESDDDEIEFAVPDEDAVNKAPHLVQIK